MELEAVPPDTTHPENTAVESCWAVHRGMPLCDAGVSSRRLEISKLLDMPEHLVGKSGLTPSKGEGF